MLHEQLTVAKWEHADFLNLEKTKCMLIGSNHKLGNIKSLSVSISDYKIATVTNFDI